MPTKKTQTKKKTTKIPVKLIKYLDKAGIDHEILEHRTVYSAIDVAKTMKRKINEIAKSLLVKADKDYYLALLPADNDLDEEKLKKVISKEKQKEVKILKIPGEKMIENALKAKANTISAFGKAHKLGVVLDKKFDKLKEAIFASGSNNHSIRMAIKDFVNLEEPIKGSFGKKKKIKKQTTAPKKRAKTTSKKSSKK